MAGMLDLYDIETGQDAQLKNEALSVAQLQPGRASVYGAGLAGGMLAQGVGGVLGLETAQEQKAKAMQSIIQKNSKLNPADPETLRVMEQDFADGGFIDISMQFGDKYRAALLAAQELKISDVPNDSAFKRLTTSLGNKILTKDMVQGYLQLKWNDSDGSVYGEVGKPFQPLSTNDVNYDAWKKQYDYDYEEAYKELEGEVENFSIDYQAQNPSKKLLNDLLKSPEKQIQNFETHVGNRGSNDAGNYLKNQVFVLSNQKRSRLKKTENSNNISAVPQESITDVMGGVIPSSTFDWAKELEEEYRIA